MKTSVKAMLLSALVIPGAGHIYLKKYLTGCVLIGISLAIFYIVISKSIELAMQMIEQIRSGTVSLDPVEILVILESQRSGGDVILYNLASAAIIVCWLVGVIDSYRIGSKLDNDKQA